MFSLHAVWHYYKQPVVVALTVKLFNACSVATYKTTLLQVDILQNLIEEKSSAQKTAALNHVLPPSGRDGLSTSK